MKKFSRRVVAALAAAGLLVGISAMTAPAQAKDTSWGYIVGSNHAGVNR